MKRILIILGILMAAAAGGLYWRQRPVIRPIYTDDDTIRTPVSGAVVREVLWQPPRLLADLSQVSGEDYEPRLSWDGLTLYFVRGKAGGAADIHVSRRTPGGWTTPEPLAELNSEYDDLGPTPSQDGESLYLYSNRPGGSGGYDLWVSRRGESGWLPPVNLGPDVNSPLNDYGPSVAADGRTLYFASNRPRAEDARQPNPDAWPATVREDLFQRDYDLYSAAITDAGFQPAVPLTGLNSASNEGAPCVSPFGDFLYFSSDRPGGRGGFDLHRARRIATGFAAAENLGAAVNTPANELDPGLSMGGYALFFSSDRISDWPATPELPTAGAQPADAEPARDRPDSTQRYRLYVSHSREVYRDLLTEARSPIDWAALWNAIAPSLTWLLLSLLLLALLLAFLRDARSRRMSLLMRCLLLSLLLHLCLMLGASFWQVGTALADAFRRGGAVRVALTSSAQAAGLSAQVRGGLTQVEAPSPVEISAERAETALRVEPATEMARLETRAIELPVEPSALQNVAARESQSSDRPPLDVRPVALDAIRRSEVPLPVMDQAQPDAAAEPAPAAPLPDQSVAISHRTNAPIASSQPAAPAARVSLEVDAAESALADALSRDSLSDSVPVREAAAVPSTEGLLNQQANAVAPPAFQTAELKTPDDVAPQEQPQREARAEVSPVAVQSDRFDLAAAESGGATSDRATPWAILPPQAAVDASVSPGVDIAPREVNAPLRSRPSAAPRADLAPPIAVDAASPALALQLPPVEAALPVSEADRAVPDPTRPASAQSALGGAPIPSSTSLSRVERAAPAVTSDGAPAVAMALLAPTAEGPAVAALPEATLSIGLPRDAPTTPRDRVAAPTLLPPSPTAAESAARDPLAIDLALPNEIEPPRAAIAREPPRPGAIRGVVIDAARGEPLAGVTVRLDLPQQEGISAETDDEGRYELRPRDVPEFFAITASRDGYIPASVNVARAETLGDGSTHDFRLEPLQPSIVALEERPDVHHLGNDRFEGRINSQFQRESEGESVTLAFNVAPEQLNGGYRRATLRMLIKGVQCPHELRINGKRLRRGLRPSPDDGSFGEFSRTFDIAALQPGENTLEITAIECSGDLDDFEFVNIQIVLKP